jgi:hypothetical protein
MEQHDYLAVVWYLVQNLCYFREPSKYFTSVISKNQAHYIKYVIQNVYHSIMPETCMYFGDAVDKYLPAPLFGYQSDTPFYYTTSYSFFESFSPAHLYCSMEKSLEQDIANWQPSWQFRWPNNYFD